MKKIIRFFIVALFITASTVLINDCKAQLRNTCTYSTCVPAIGFNNTDLMQIYGAVLRASSGSGSISVISGTVNAGGFTAKPQSTLTADGSYTAGLNIGGIRTFTASRTGQRSGLINDVTIWDPSNAKPPIVVDIWAASPTGTFTNMAIQVMTSPLFYLGSFTVSASDYVTTGSVARVNKVGLDIAYFSQSAELLYYTVQATGAVSFTNKTLYFSFGVLQD